MITTYTTSQYSYPQRTATTVATGEAGNNNLNGIGGGSLDFLKRIDEQLQMSKQNFQWYQILHLKLLHLFFLEMVSLTFPLPITDSCFVFVNILKSILILHKLLVILLINWIFLSLDLVTKQHFLIVLIFLSFFLLLLSHLNLLSHR